MFDYSKAIEFYIDWLGFTQDWVHEFEPENTPKFIQISFKDVTLYLSEHHGDGSPGAHINIEGFKDLKDYQQQLIAKQYKYGRPGIEVAPWDDKTITLTVYDPFNNRLTFTETLSK
jgi:catechol 2,3-dioxygenase-like lactoylglutathione lyase family enzyme